MRTTSNLVDSSANHQLSTSHGTVSFTIHSRLDCERRQERWIDSGQKASRGRGERRIFFLVRLFAIFKGAIQSAFYLVLLVWLEPRLSNLGKFQRIFVMRPRNKGPVLNLLDSRSCVKGLSLFIDYDYIVVIDDQLCT